MRVAHESSRRKTPQRGKSGREDGPAAGVGHGLFVKPAIAAPNHRIDGRAGKPDADACDFGADTGRFDVVLGVAILPCCNVSGAKCAARGFSRGQAVKPAL
jgi:hypothetical protein